VTRQAYGMGSITPHRGGFRLRMVVNGKRRSIGGIFPTVAAAEAERDATLLALGATAPGALTGTTWRAFGVTFLAGRELDGVRGIRTERSRWATHIDTAPFADDPVDALATPTVDAWVKQLQRKMTATPRRTPTKLSRKTVREALRLLSMACERAMVLGLMAWNPCAPIKVRSEARTHEPWTYLLPAEQTALLTCPAIPETDRLIMGVALGTGLREGELFSLRLRDVRLDGDHPEIVVRLGSKHRGTKSGKVATIPLFDLGLASMRRWLALLPDYTRDANGTTRNPDGLVFPGKHGGHRGAGKNLHVGRTVTGADGKRKAVKIDVFREHLAAAGIVAAQRHDGRLPRWHDLRHTCASSLVAGWWGRPWSLPEVCAYLRHSSIVVTQRYAHLGQTALRDAAAATGRGTVNGTPTGHGLSTSVLENAVIQAVGRRGLEPRTNGLKARDGHKQDQELAAHLVPMASRVMTMLGSGDTDLARELGVALAEQALRTGVGVDKALAVLRGGPMMLPHLVTLCDLLSEAGAAVDAGAPREKSA